MSIHIFLNDKAFADRLKDAGHQVETFAIGEFDKAVAAAKTTEIGKAAVDAIHAAEDTSLNGPEKMEHAIAAVAPVVIDYLSRGGVSAVVADARQFAQSLIESTLADVKETPAAKVAKEVLALLGVK